MARKRDPNRDKALEMFLEKNGNITNRTIALQLGVDEKKIAVWKGRDKWIEQLESTRLHTTSRKDTTNKIRSKRKKEIVDALIEAKTYSPALEFMIELYLDAYEEYIRLKNEGQVDEKNRKELAGYLNQLGLDFKGLKPKPRYVNKEENKEEQPKSDNKLLEFRRKFAK